MNKPHSILIGICFGLFSQAAFADCHIAIKKSKVGVCFINGVDKTKYAATATMNALNKLTKYRAELFYNHTQGLTLDLLETYQQRVVEMHPEMAGRYDLMADMLSANGAATQKLLDSGDAGIVASIRAFRAAVVKLEQDAMERVAAMTRMDYKEHNSQLQKKVQEDSRVVLVAHSQGNLFANHAFEILGDDRQKKVEVLHVAPASVRVHGKYLLSDLDLIIKPLATADGRLPSDVLSWVDARVSRSADWSGHGFVEVYLNSALPFVKQIVKAINGEDGANNDELYGAYRWDGSIDYHGAKGTAWMKTEFNGKIGAWQTSNGCSGDVVLESLESGKWKAKIRTKYGPCPSNISADVVAQDKDAKEIAVMPFGINEWVIGAVKPALAGFGIKGNNLLMCTNSVKKEVMAANFQRQK